jgi:hypothetical protein
MANIDLTKFEKIAVNNFVEKINESKNREFKLQTQGDFYFECFHDVKFDGIAFEEKSKSLILIEVALGGDAIDFKTGPKRKMLTDGFKLSAVDSFFKDKSDVKVEQKVLICKNSEIVSKINTGWAKKAFSFHRIDVLEATFKPNEQIEIDSIIQDAINEQTKK